MTQDLEKRRESTRRGVAKMYAGRIARGLCKTCGAEALPERQKCSDCFVRERGYTRKRHERNMARGLCIHCGGKPSRPGKQACLDCAVSHYKRREQIGESP